MNTHIATAVAFAGSQTSLANLIGAAPAFVSQWVNGRRPVPPRFAREIETATGGKVTRYDLRPDVFGAAPAAAAPVEEPDPDANRIEPVETP